MSEWVRNNPLMVLGALLATAGVLLGAWSVLKRPADVRNESAGFVAEKPPPKKPAKPKAATLPRP